MAKNKIGIITSATFAILYPIILILIWYNFYGGKIKNILFGIVGFLVYGFFIFIMQLYSGINIQ